jgi:hypothetical protein
MFQRFDAESMEVEGIGPKTAGAITLIVKETFLAGKQRIEEKPRTDNTVVTVELIQLRNFRL